MKMVKSLLLGSAAGLVAVAGAQAADLPVKAKPVEYVKVCSIYGAGFFYIPGTDTCIKIGGWVRAEMDFNAGASHTHFYSGAGGRNNRIDTDDTTMRSRFVISNDIRTQTEYGTLRAYSRAGFDIATRELNGGRFYIERSFIQFAGFTVGRTQSYFDFYAGAHQYTGYIGGPTSTGATGTVVFAYTATFGNGFTATLAVEDPSQRRNAIWDAGTDALTIGGFPGPTTYAPGGPLGGGFAGANAVGDYGASQVPDIVGSLRVDQAWGSAQIAAALHQVRAGYFGNNTTPGGVGSAAYTGVAPSDKWGFAVMAGIVLNLPWAKGDQFWVEGAYTVGAPGYTSLSAGAVGDYNTWQRFNGGNVAAAWALDAIFGNVGTAAAPSGSLELTTVWTIGASLQHYWTPALRSSIFGAYTSVDFNGAATAMFCSGGNTPVRTVGGLTPAQAGIAFNNVAGLAGCNPDFNIWGVGSRTIWNPVPNLDIGVEVVYANIQTKFDSGTTRLNFGGSGGRAAGLYTPSSENVWSGILRVQRNFWP